MNEIFWLFFGVVAVILLAVGYFLSKKRDEVVAHVHEWFKG